MSSIISDLFYGSKHNILDNYLAQRQPQLTPSHQHSLHSFIEFLIKLPFIHAYPHSLKVRVEMGSHSEEAKLQAKSSNQNWMVVLTLQDIDKAQLGRHTSVKFEVAEGEGRQSCGFVPIETIKAIAGSFSGEKAVQVKLKGKSCFDWLHCTIRTQLVSNTILNSEIMRSVEKEQTSKQISYEQGPSKSYLSSQHQTLKEKPVKKRREEVRKRREEVQRHSNVVIEDSSEIIDRKGHKSAAVTQYVKEVKSIKIIFTQVQLTDSQALPQQLQFVVGELRYGLQQIIELRGVSTQGFKVEVAVGGKLIGSIHLSPLLLTLASISGELPIFSPTQQCKGTVQVQSPHRHQHPPKIIPSQPVALLIERKEEKEEDSELVVISLEKILLARLSNSLLPAELAYCQFSRMEVNKVEVLLRINGLTHRLADALLRYSIDGELRVVELRRKEGFTVSCFQQAQQELRIEIQVFSAYRLICYAKTSLKRSHCFAHQFIPAFSECDALHSAIYLKAARLHSKGGYLLEHKVEPILKVLEDLVAGKILLEGTSDAQIKRVMNFHQRLTYIELKKLFLLLEKSLMEFRAFQRGRLLSVYDSDRSQVSRTMMKMSLRLLEQFAYVGKDGKVSVEQFNKIIQFYREDLRAALEQNYQVFVGNAIGDAEGVNFLFFAAGFYFISGQQQQQSNQKITGDVYIDRVVPAAEEPIKRQGLDVKVSQVEASYYIGKISISNAHLLNQGKAPNICLNLSKKICYSNSHPEFNLQKEVSLLHPIVIYHKSISEDRLVKLAEFELKRRQTYYQLQPSGKCMAKVTWGL